MKTRGLNHLFMLLTGHLWLMINSVEGQSEICHFNNLNADCRYRVDLICLSHITAEVDPCADPMEVTFRIKCSSPIVDFSHTFSGSKTMVTIPGYKRQTFLEVKMRMKEDQVLNIEADIHVYGLASTDFINDDINLAGYNEKCPGLNEAAKIAIGVMGGLAVIAACLIVFLLYLRHKQRKRQHSRPQLVENCEDLGQSTPRSSRNLDIPTSQVLQNSISDHHATNNGINEGHVTSASHVTGASHVTSVSHVTSASNVISASNVTLQDGPSESHNHSQDGLQNGVNPGKSSLRTDWDSTFSTDSDKSSVRYSDMLQTQGESNLKISDC